jgi:surface antigen
MTYSEWKNKWLGKGIDYDGSYGNQCMDVYRMYVKEVLNIPQSPPVIGAKDVWNTYLTEYFDRVSNTPDGVPEQGDIAIWSVGTYGHIGIVDSADKQYLTCFEQNWTEMNGTGVTELRRHTYANVLGWLKYKSSLYRGYDLSNKDSMRVAVDKLIEILEGKYITSEEHQRIINELDSKSTEQAKLYATEKQKLEEKISILDEALRSLQDSEHSWEVTADTYERKLKVVIDFLRKNDIDISIESDETILSSALSDATHAEEIADLYAAINSRLTLSEMSPQGFLEALDALEMGYNKQIETLKKKQPTLWQFIINKYFTK